MKFVVNGGSSSAPSGRIPSVVARMISVLDAMKDGELIDSEFVAAKIGVGRDRVQSFASHALIAEYRAKVPNRTQYYYGNKATIREWKRQMEKGSA